MSLICYKPKDSCHNCLFYKMDKERERMACYAKQDGAKITEIICDAFNKENADDFHIWISYIMSYGFKPEEVREYAAVHNIKIGTESDPDDPQDNYGCLIITPMDVARLLSDN